MSLLKSVTFFALMLVFGVSSCRPALHSTTEPVSEKELAEAEQFLRQLSADKWQWMADKEVEKLADLFDDSAKFVHMSGSWKKPRELEIIESGSIWYKQAHVHDVAVELSGNLAILWNRITLDAVVRENEVSNEFTVTEVYQKQGQGWKMMALTFSKVRDNHEIVQ